MREGVTSPLCRPRHNGKEVSLKDYPRLQHTRGEGKYHGVFSPQYRRKALFTALRKDLGAVFRELARRQGCRGEEGPLRSEQVPRLVSLPPKSAVAALVGERKGKSAIPIARTYRGKERTFTGEHFWAWGYWVSTVGADEGAIREYLRDQAQEDLRLDQLKLFK